MNPKGWLSGIGRTQLILLIVVIAPYFLLYLPRQPFFDLTKEDGLLEYISAVFYLVATIACFLLFLRAKNFKNPDHQRIYSTFIRRYAFLLLGLLLAVSLGEEISWGQRLLGFDTPEVIAAHNVQGEFNFHNLELFNPRTLDETPKEGLGAIFTARRVFIGLFAVYFFLLPLLIAFIPMIRKLVQLFYIPIPPFWLGLLYMGNIFLFMVINRSLGDDRMLKGGISEVEELNISFLIMLLPLMFWYFPQLLSSQARNRGLT